MIKAFVAISLFVFGYMIGYNSGSNNGYQTAIKFAPECKK